MVFEFTAYAPSMTALIAAIERQASELAEGRNHTVEHGRVRPETEMRADDGYRRVLVWECPVTVRVDFTSGDKAVENGLH
jgi:hypothetical protein